jgi:hypothetical protein
MFDFALDEEEEECPFEQEADEESDPSISMGGPESPSEFVFKPVSDVEQGPKGLFAYLWKRCLGHNPHDAGAVHITSSGVMQYEEWPWPIGSCHDNMSPETLIDWRKDSCCPYGYITEWLDIKLNGFSFILKGIAIYETDLPNMYKWEVVGSDGDAEWTQIASIIGLLAMKCSCMKCLLFGSRILLRTRDIEFLGRIFSFGQLSSLVYIEILLKIPALGRGYVRLNFCIARSDLHLLTMTR